MDQLETIVQREVWHYAVKGDDLLLLPFSNSELRAWCVLVADTSPQRQAAGIVVFVRLVADYVVIEEDKTDRPLYQALERAGIRREKIICVYAGEPLPSDMAASQENVRLPTP